MGKLAREIVRDKPLHGGEILNIGLYSPEVTWTHQALNRDPLTGQWASPSHQASDCPISRLCKL